MQLYLYSAQDLILESNALHSVKAGNFYKLDINQSEMVKAYPTQSAGMMVFNYDILCKFNHNHIIYHKINDNAILCEIKPFITLEYAQQYTIKGASLRLVPYLNEMYIYFNGEYYGYVNQKCNDIKFEKFNEHNQEIGLISINGKKKYLILFVSSQVLFCGQYIDYEKLSNYIQIYCHIPNMFNVGNLIKYNFSSNQLEYKIVRDRDDDKVIDNKQFNIISFLESLKCGRYKYAHKKLSYELKSEIDIDTLNKYFKVFDRYDYINEQNAYITLHNNKIINIVHIIINNDMIDSIY